MRVCANLSWLFSEAGPSLADRCVAAKRAGFLLVESDWPDLPASDYRTALDAAGLKPVLVNCYQGDRTAGECGFAAEPGEEQRFKSGLDTTLQYAATIGAAKIHLLSGRDLSGQGVSPADQEQTLIRNLRFAVPVLEKQNVVALLEPINSISKPGYFLNNYETAWRVITAVGSPLVRLQLDVFHMQMISGNIVNNISKLLPLIGHVQVAQAPHRHEPSLAGELNYKFIFNQLSAAGYTGYVGCEYKPASNTEASLDWIQEYGLQY
ncbi:Xylose isomerase-like TIM barrel domain [Trinorchestia longiramus]|nr:Xylose isomerase-like TIM barrel domain [Trinorchestia longiramus]